MLKAALDAESSSLRGSQTASMAECGIRETRIIKRFNILFDVIRKFKYFNIESSPDIPELSGTFNNGRNVKGPRGRTHRKLTTALILYRSVS